MGGARIMGAFFMSKVFSFVDVATVDGGQGPRVMDASTTSRMRL